MKSLCRMLAQFFAVFCHTDHRFLLGFIVLFFRESHHKVMIAQHKASDAFHHQNDTFIEIFLFLTAGVQFLPCLFLQSCRTELQPCHAVGADMPLSMVLLVYLYYFRYFIYFFSISLIEDIFQRLSFPVGFNLFSKCFNILRMDMKLILRPCGKSLKLLIHPSASAFRKDNPITDSCRTVAHNQFLRFCTDLDLLQ